MSSGTRRAHPIGYKSSTRTGDVWQRWFNEFGLARGYKDVSEVDRNVEQKVLNHRTMHGPNTWVSEVSVTRGSLEGRPRIHVQTGVLHRVRYFQWRGPSVIESFMEEGAKRPTIWRRQPSHFRNPRKGSIKRWARPAIPIPIDGTVYNLSVDISKEMGCHVHVQMFDTQWFIGGPKAQVEETAELWSHNKFRWFKDGLLIAHAAIWLASPKMLVDFMVRFGTHRNNKKHTMLMKFIAAIGKLYVGRPHSFLKAVRVEMKGKFQNAARKQKKKLIVGYGDSHVDTAPYVRSYQREILSTRGLVNLRVMFFYASPIHGSVDTRDWLGQVNDAPDDSFISDEKLKDHEIAPLMEAAQKGHDWIESTGRILERLQNEVETVPKEGRWGFKLETLKTHLDLFRERGLKNIGFWNRTREHPNYRYRRDAEGGVYTNNALGRHTDRRRRDRWARRTEEFTGALPHYIQFGMPKSLDALSIQMPDFAERPTTAFDLFPLTAFPVAHEWRGMGQYQWKELRVYKRRVQRLRMQEMKENWEQEASSELEGRRWPNIPAKIPWWFKQMEELRMSRQYWKKKHKHERRRGEGKKMYTTDFYQVWTACYGMERWSHPELRYLNVPKDDMGNERTASSRLTRLRTTAHAHAHRQKGIHRRPKSRADWYNIDMLFSGEMKRRQRQQRRRGRRGRSGFRNQRGFRSQYNYVFRINRMKRREVFARQIKTRQRVKDSLALCV